MKAKSTKKQAGKHSDAWHHAARKTGESVRFSFLRCIKRQMECTIQEAETIFESAVQSGVIVHTGMAGFLLDVPKYKIK